MVGYKIAVLSPQEDSPDSYETKSLISSVNKVENSGHTTLGLANIV